MKTATVRDLRNRFASVAKWLEEGELVTITRHGTPLATLTPAAPIKPRKADWAKRLAQRPALGRQMTKQETASLWSALRD
jgi:prevent-host-death family protein